MESSGFRPFCFKARNYFRSLSDALQTTITNPL
jgi:hypothetical protein